MTHFDDIYEIAADDYGIVTAAQARSAGITTGEMSRWCASGKLVRRGQGVYKLTQWVPTPYDSYAEAVALVGEGGFLWGESVLSFHGLALVDPAVITVATTRRVRRTLPRWIKQIAAPEDANMTFYEGIASQRLAEAIETCKQTVMSERLLDAAKQAKARGLISAIEYESLRRELP